MCKKGSVYILIFVLILAFAPSCKKYYASEDPEKNQLVDLGTGSEATDDYIWSTSKMVHITLNGNTITSDSSVAIVSDSKVTITSSGNYSISGTLTNGQIVVNSTVKGIVRLILNGANIACSSGAPVYIKNAEKTLIVLTDNTENYITDGVSYILNSDNEPNAAVFSKSYLSFYGGGTLTVKANYKDGISSKDGLLIKNGNIKITAVDDGIRGKDYIIVREGNVTVNAGGDGLKSDNDNGADYGYITLESGIFNITSVMDGIKSESEMVIKGGKFVINTSGNAVLNASGSGYDPSFCNGISSNENITVSVADISVKCTGTGGKGIKSKSNITISSGTLNIVTTGAGAIYKNTGGTADSYSSSCISADGNINILKGSVTANSSGLAGKGIKTGGTFTAGDANNSPHINITTSGSKLQVSGSGININYTSAKAVKSTGAVNINNGTVTISSADDGIKSESSITIANAIVSIIKSTEGMESPVITVNRGDVSITASDDGFNATKGLNAGGGETNDGSLLTINGGNVIVNVTNIVASLSRFRR